MNDFKIIASEIEMHLNGVSVQVYSSLPSTNSYAKGLISPSGGKPRVIIALEQTEGRGRLNKSFFSPRGGLYMSVLLYPDYSLELAQRLTPAAAVSVCEAIEAHTVHKPRIKWVNDVMIDGKKVCGILTEAVCCENKNAVIIGIGVNLNSADINKDITDKACALNCETLDINLFAADIISRLLELAESPESDEVIQSYSVRLLTPKESDMDEVRRFMKKGS